MMASALKSLSHKASNTFFANLLDKVPSLIFFTKPAKRSAEIGDSAKVFSARFKLAANSPFIQFATNLPSFDAWAAVSK